MFNSYCFPVARRSVAKKIWPVFFAFRYNCFRIWCAHFPSNWSCVPIFQRSSFVFPFSRISSRLSSPAIGRQSCRRLLAGKFTHCFQFFESSNGGSRPCIEWDGVKARYIHQNGRGWINMYRLWQEDGSRFADRDTMYGSELLSLSLSLSLYRVLSAALRPAEGPRRFLYRCFSLANLLSSKALSKRHLIPSRMSAYTDKSREEVTFHHLA